MMKRFIAALLLLATQLQAAPLTVVKNSDLPTVTAGVPFQPCAITDINKFKLLNASNQEVATFVKPLMYWPSSKCGGVQSIRAIKLQFAFAPGVYDWSLSGSTLPHLAEQPIGEVVSSNPLKAGFKEPAHFAINDPAYLVTTGIIPPTTIAGNNNHDKVWYPAAFAKHVAATNFAKNEAMEWLFDPVSSLYQQALRTGSVEQYREAYLEHEFWISKMNLAGMGVDTDFYRDACVGGFNMDYEPGRSVAKAYDVGGLGCDEKWTYLNPWKLHLALTGDDSWTPQEIGGRISPVGDTREKLINEIGTRAFSNGWARTSALDVPYTDVAEVFTERGAGFAIQRQVAAYELTLNPVLLQNLYTSITNLHLMMTNNPDGLGNHGYFSHSWGKHEGWYPAYFGSAEVVPNATISKVTVSQLVLDDYKLVQAGTSIRMHGTFTGVLYTEDLATGPAVLNPDGTVTITLKTPFTPLASPLTVSISDRDPATYKSAADRVFSPWMQSIIADGLWQAYQIIDDAGAKAKIEEMLLGFGHAITAYAMDGQWMNPATKQLIDTAFGVTITTQEGWWGGKGGPFPRYVSSYLTATGTSQNLGYALNNQSGPYADHHSPEMLFQLSLALKFETNPAKKTAMTALANDFLFWFESADRAPEFPPREFAWTSKPNAWGTYEYITGNAGPLPPVVVPPVEPPPVVVVPPPVVVPPVVVPLTEAQAVSASAARNGAELTAMYQAYIASGGTAAKLATKIGRTTKWVTARLPKSDLTKLTFAEMDELAWGMGKQIVISPQTASN